MTALMIDSPWAVGLIVVIALLLFGGTRLAGLGKSAGRAIKEFKEETGLANGDQASAPVAQVTATPSAQTGTADTTTPATAPADTTTPDTTTSGTASEHVEQATNPSAH